MQEQEGKELCGKQYTVHLMEWKKNAPSWKNIGAEFWSLESSYESIFENFSVLNYLNPVHKFVIKKRFKFDSDIFGSDYVSGELFSFCKADGDEENKNKYRIMIRG